MDYDKKKTWAEISLENIAHNYREIRKNLKDDCRFLGVVKANAYGHGAVPVSRLLEDLGAEYLAVGCIDEAKEVRLAGVKLPILIFGAMFPEFTEKLLEYDLTQTIVSLDAARGFSEKAMQKGKKLKAHIKIDSGMGRIGFVSREGFCQIEDMLSAMKLPGLEIEGIYTHFAVGDVPEDDFTAKQMERFTATVSKLEKESGKRIEIKHCANSGAVLNWSWTHLDMVRPGLALYGVYPGVGEHESFSLKPAMELKTRIVQVRDFFDGESVSYGRTYVAPGHRRVAVIPIGYADGYFRGFSNNHEMLVRGSLAPVIGRVCMSMTMLDVTGIEGVSAGDCVTVFGEGNPIEKASNAVNTIPYELMCAVSTMVPRIYDAAKT